MSLPSEDDTFVLPITFYDEDDAGEDADYPRYDVLVEVGIRRYLRGLEQHGYINDLDLEEFTQLQEEGKPVFKWDFGQPGAIGNQEGVWAYNARAQQIHQVNDRYPWQLRSFLREVLEMSVDIKVVDGIYKIDPKPGTRAYDTIYNEIMKQIGRILSYFVVYMVLLPDESIRYGFDLIYDRDE
jgi:hypothetical protein